MRYRLRTGFIALAITIALVAAGCGDSGSDTATTPAATGAASPTTAVAQPVRGGTITMLMVADTGSFDPAKMSTGTLGHEGQLVYDHLFYFDSNLKPLPGLALSADVDTTGAVWKIKLRPNVKFTDGTPFDASAVKAHFERVKNPATKSLAQGPAGQIDSVTVNDDLTLTVTLGKPDFTWNLALGAEATTGALTMVPSPTAVAKYGDKFGTSPETTVGAGPFVLTNWITGDSATFKRNDNYWDTGKPYLDGFVYKVIADETTRYNTFTSGGVQMMYSVGVLLTLGKLAKAYPTGIGPFAGSVSMYYNMGSGPTTDLRVREALSVGADLDAAINQISEGALQAPHSLFPTNGPFANSVEFPKYNPELAKSNIKAYLAETGKSSVDLTIRGNSAHTAIATALKQYYDKIPGLNVTLGLEPTDTGREARREYEGIFISSFPELPRALLPKLLSTSGSNLSILKDPAMDAALLKGVGTTDISEIKGAMNVVAQRYNATIPLRGLYLTLRQWNWQKNVQGVDIAADVPVHTQDLWLSK